MTSRGLSPLNPELLSYHENLTSGNHRVTSPDSDEYNCIAWAAEDTSNWWWPSQNPEDAFWPEGIDRMATLDAFQAAFMLRGFEPCLEDAFEPGYEKIAVYVLNDVPTHAARQLPNGRWTSKLGDQQDIEHDSVDAVSDRTYGRVELILRRPRAGEAERQRRRRTRQARP